MFNEHASAGAFEILPTKQFLYSTSTAFAEVDASVDLKGRPVTIVQSIAQVADHSANDFAQELSFTIDTLKRNGAGPVWVVMPNNGYDRQDKSRDGHRDAIAAQFFAKQLKLAGAVGVSSIETHSDKAVQLQEGVFGEGNVFSIDPTSLYETFFRSRNITDIVVGGPDGGANERADSLATVFGTHVFRTTKVRVDGDDPTATELTSFDGDVKGRDVVIVDDVTDSGGTAIECAKRLKEEGANRIFLVVAHGALTGNSVIKLYKEKNPVNRSERLFERAVMLDTIDPTQKINRYRRGDPAIDDFYKVIPIDNLLKDHITDTVQMHPSMGA
jgi:ribose-phosphate pyrophosphokinase